jgi:hypothetical protein
MMGRDRDQRQLFYEFSFMIPADHLLRRINVFATAPTCPARAIRLKSLPRIACCFIFHGGIRILGANRIDAAVSSVWS